VRERIVGAQAQRLLEERDRRVLVTLFAEDQRQVHVSVGMVPVQRECPGERLHRGRGLASVLENRGQVAKGIRVVRPPPEGFSKGGLGGRESSSGLKHIAEAVVEIGTLRKHPETVPDRGERLLALAKDPEHLAQIDALGRILGVQRDRLPYRRERTVKVSL